MTTSEKTKQAAIDFAHERAARSHEMIFVWNLGEKYWVRSASEGRPDAATFVMKVPGKFDLGYYIGRSEDE